MECILNRIKEFLKNLSFRTGLFILGLCILFYAISFLQFFLAISIEIKGILWIIFFGLAKTAQYSAILILGKEGFYRLKQYIKKIRK